MSDKPINHRRSKKKTILDSYKDDIANIYEKTKIAKKIYEILKEKGYKGSYSTIKNYIKELEKNKKKRKFININKIMKIISANKISDEEKMILENIIEKYEGIKLMYKIISEFKDIIKNRKIEKLEGYIKNIKELKIREINRFIEGIEKDKEAVKNAILYKYNNGLIEGIINKLKTIKRQMYGRASLILLRNKLIFSANL